MIFCQNCGLELDPVNFKEADIIELEETVIRIVLENSRSITCPRCGDVNIQSDDADWKKSLAEALMREFACLPVSLKGRQLKWAVNYMAVKAGVDEKFASWLGFKNFYFLKQWGLSFDEPDTALPTGEAVGVMDIPWEHKEKAFTAGIFLNEAKLLLARKLGFKNADEVAELNDDTGISDDVDEKAKKALSRLGDSGKFPSRLEFIDGYYVIFVRMNDASEADLAKSFEESKKRKEEILKRDLEQINRVFSQVKIRKISWRSFRKMVKNGVIRICLTDSSENGEEKIIGIVFCSFCQEKNREPIIRVEKAAIDQNYAGDRQIVLKMFRGILTHALAKKAEFLFFQKPKQKEIEAIALELGFFKIDSEWYGMLLD